MVGDKVVDIRKAVLVKQWSHTRACMRALGCTALRSAERVVPFNERFNATMQILDDWAQRAATGAERGGTARESIPTKCPAGAMTAGVLLETADEDRQ